MAATTRIDAHLRKFEGRDTDLVPGGRTVAHALVKLLRSDAVVTLTEGVGGPGHVVAATYTTSGQVAPTVAGVLCTFSTAWRISSAGLSGMVHLPACPRARLTTSVGGCSEAWAQVADQASNTSPRGLAMSWSRIP
jgi:hypothetical protein